MSDSPVAVLHNVAGTEVGTAGNPLRIEPAGSTSQPITATSLPLPTGAATSAKQPAIGTAGTPSADVISVQGVSGGTPQPVSGTVTANAGTGPFPVSDNGGSLTVDGPLTDAQLRAAVVPVGDGGGSITVDGPITDAQLRATAVPVSGPLTDAQLRATAVPVSGSFSSAVIPNPTDTTGTIAALNATVAAALQGWSSCAVVLTGTWSGALVFEVSSDGGATWIYGAFVIPPAGVSPVPGLAVAVSANGTYEVIGIGATTNVRVRAALWTSGTASVRLIASNAPQAITASFASIQQNVAASLYNNSTTNLAALGVFTGAAETTLGVAGIQVNVKSSQPIEVQVQQSPDGTNWDISDVQNFEAGEGDGRTFQAVASYFRLVVTNIGGIATTYFRLQTALCPVVEVVPRTLTPNGRLRIASMTDSWAPDPYNYQDRSKHRGLLMDTDRNLNVRARCLTDEASFRDDFTAADMYADLAGTCYFVNGSLNVVGVGTAFLANVAKGSFIKLSAHANSTYAEVVEVVSDTRIRLGTAYTGATASGTGRDSEWFYAIGSGGAITQTGSEILLATGTTSGANTQAKRQGDYSPIVIGFKARVTQRIANQEIHVGLADGDIGAVQAQALVVFDGTTNTTVKLRTSFSSLDVEETTVTLPNGAVSSTGLFYQLEVTANKVVLFISGIKVAEHQLHIPGPYSSMDCHVCAYNTGTAASSTTLALDTYYLNNFDRVEVATSPKGDPLSTKEQRAGLSVVTSVAAAVADTALFALNVNRLGAAITNDSTALLYLKLGTGASATSHTVQIPRGGYYEIPFGYTGPVNGYWTAATGSARCTEVQ
jgi:hypothetical protein